MKVSFGWIKYPKYVVDDLSVAAVAPWDVTFLAYALTQVGGIRESLVVVLWLYIALSWLTFIYRSVKQTALRPMLVRNEEELSKLSNENAFGFDVKLDKVELENANAAYTNEEIELAKSNPYKKQAE